MAKKAKYRLEEQEKEEAFRFPDFDERRFLAHEYEQSVATVIAVLLAVVLAAVSWGLERSALPIVLPWVLGFVGVIGGPFVIRSVRPLASEYTKGDWGWLILTVLLGWLGFWFLLVELLP